MYNAYFNFKEAPFSIAPDPRYLYMTAQHREALAHLVYGLNSEGGCILLTGEVGTGKTTVCRCLLEQIPEHTHIALVVNPKVTAIELLETICDELKIDYPGKNNTVKTYIDRINAFLIDANARNEKTVLIIDEAQNLDNSVLEQLRLLTNLETNQRKLLQIIILGQPELLAILSRPEMRQLAQRITARFHLNALSRGEVKAYINHRLAIAGQNAQLFPDHTITQLYRLSHGIPRLLNVICDRALLGTYVQSKPAVDSKTLTTAAKEVFGELKHQPHKTKNHYLPRLAAVVVVVIAALGSALALLNPDFLDSLLNNRFTAYLELRVADAGFIAAQADATSEPTAIEPVLPAATETTVADVVEADAVEADEAEANVTETETTAPEVTDVDADTSTARVAASPASELIRNFIHTADDDDNETAFATLLQYWKPEYQRATGVPVCRDAAHGLSCFQHRGNLSSLRKLNRPAVLKLYADDGKIAHTVITQLDRERVTLASGSHRFEIDSDTLEEFWYGEFSLLWQPPPFYQQPILPNSSGPVVQWLGQELTRLYGHKHAPTIYNVYTEALVSQVKAFQQRNGLIPDGIVGPLTLIHLNTEIGLQAPLLTARSPEES